MAKSFFQTAWAVLGLICILGISLFAQGSRMREEFLIDVNRPFVYVKFVQTGPGVPRNPQEPTLRIWLRLQNNCRIPVDVRANGVPDGSPGDEVGLNYEVVPERVGGIQTSSGILDQLETDLNADRQKPKPQADQIPLGYMSELYSLVTIDPGTDALFSIPVNHLSKRWHIEIPFTFNLPKGKGPRDPKNGGTPVMVVSYSLWDLPPESRTEIKTRVGGEP